MKWIAVLAAALLTGQACAQTNVDGDPHADDPVGIVANPCPDHPKPSDGQGWHPA